MESEKWTKCSVIWEYTGKREDIVGWTLTLNGQTAGVVLNIERNCLIHIIANEKLITALQDGNYEMKIGP